MKNNKGLFIHYTKEQIVGFCFNVFYNKDTKDFVFGFLVGNTSFGIGYSF